MIARQSSLLLGFTLLACAVDDRALANRPPPVEMGAGGEVNGVDAGGDEGGAGGASSLLPSGPADGCADLDTDGVSDCEVTLVENPTFQSDIDGWTALGDAELEWEPESALGDSETGSAKLTAEVPRASAYQCVPLEGAKLVIAYASAYVEPSDDPDEAPQAELDVTFFQGANCSGVSDGYFETPPSKDVGTWATIQAGGLSKDTTQSVAVALVGIKPDSVDALAVRFDNVMLKAQEP